MHSEDYSKVPLWQRIKPLRAGKIADIVLIGEHTTYRVTLDQESGGFSFLTSLTPEQRPLKVGGYIVLFEDGGVSYEDAERFEKSFQKLTDPD